MFLNDEDLFRLTGYRQKTKQIAHLKASKIPFHVDRYGRPVVAVSQREELLRRQALATERIAVIDSIDKQIHDLKLKRRNERAAHKAGEQSSAKPSTQLESRGIPVFLRARKAQPISRSSAIRRHRLRQRTPSWADRNAMREIYEQARRLTEQTGIVHHVDHCYPLAGRHVSGLHVHNNLRVITAMENRRKFNKLHELWGVE